MISVIIPTLNAEKTLTPTLTALVPAVVDGVVQEAILADAGSSDDTRIIADAAGTQLIDTQRGRRAQLDAGAAAARGDWLLFLPADAVLEPGWAEEAQAFIERIDSGRRSQAAAFFRFALDDDGIMPRLVESWVGLRCLLLALPRDEQGMLISRKLYDRLGGFRPAPPTENADLSRRLRRREIVLLNTRAVVSAQHYQRDGYLARGLRNLGFSLLRYLRAPARVLSRLYG